MQKIYKISGLLCILCLVSGLFAGYVLAATPTATTFLNPGSLTETTSWTVWKENTNYFIKDGTSGQIINPTNISQQLETIRTENPNGGEIVFKVATFTLDHTFWVGDNFKISGEGNPSILTIKDGVDAPVIANHGWDTTSYGIIIENIQINGNAEGQSAGTFVGINLVNTWGAIVRNCYITNVKTHAIAVQDSVAARISDNTILNNGGDGIQLWNKGDYGAGLHTCEASNNFIESNNDTGIVSIHATGNIITGNTVIASGFNGILLDCATYNIVDSNLVISSSKLDTGSCGIRLQNMTYTTSTDHNIISNNRVFDWDDPKTQYWGIFEHDSADYNIIIGNDCEGNLVDGIWIEGGNTKVSDCYNGTAWIGTSNIRTNAGTFTSASPVTITHGVGFNLSSVQLTPLDSGITDMYVSAKNWTHFEVTYTGSLTNGVYWYAEYRP